MNNNNSNWVLNHFTILTRGFLLLLLIISIFLTGQVFADDANVLEEESIKIHESPDYEAVFSDDCVYEITIIIDNTDWELMQDDLQTNFSKNNQGPQEPATPPDRNMNISSAFPGMGMGMMGTDSDPMYVPATVVFNGSEWDHVGVRYKGFSSLTGAVRDNIGKISLKIDMDRYEDEYPETKNQRMYGFDELNLQSNFKDSSLLRDKVVPEIFREAGVVAPDTAFYRVFVDHGDGPEYFGLYTMVESVEDTLISTRFADDSGNVYKPEEYGATFALGSLNLSSFHVKTNKKGTDYSDIEQLYEVIHSDDRIKNPEKWREDLESVFNVQGFLLWLATNTIIENWDTYGENCRNFYLYSDPTSKTLTWIPWDNNFALRESMPDMGEDKMNENMTPPQGFGPPGTQDLNLTAGMMGNGPVRPPWLDIQGNISPNMGPGKRENMTGFMPMGPGGGGMMGNSTLSLSLDEVEDTWPLIRFIIDDAEYRADYNRYLEEIINGAFEPEKMADTYTYYHNLIALYVTGAEGERQGYTYISNETEFEDSLDELISHAQKRYEAVSEYL